MRGGVFAALAMTWLMFGTGCDYQPADDGAPGLATGAISVEQPGGDASAGDPWTDDTSDPAAVEPAPADDTSAATGDEAASDDDPATGGDEAMSGGGGSGDEAASGDGASDDEVTEGDGGSDDEATEGDDGSGDEATEGDGGSGDDEATEGDDGSGDEATEGDDTEGGGSGGFSDPPTFDFALCEARPGKAGARRNFGLCVSCCQRACDHTQPCANTCARQICLGLKTKPPHPVHPLHPHHR